MSNHTFKEYKDVSDGKHVVDSLKYAIKWRDIPIRDPFGPVKYDLYERIAASYLETIPVVAQRIDAIEEHLEQGTGRPFVRSTELPDVGSEVVGELREGIALIGKQLDQIRRQVG